MASTIMNLERWPSDKYIEDVLHPVLEVVYYDVIYNCFSRRLGVSSSRSVETLRQMLHVKTVINCTYVRLYPRKELILRPQLQNNLRLFEKYFAAALKRVYTQLYENHVTEETFIFVLSVGMDEDDKEIAHSICLVLKFVNRAVRMSMFDPNGDFQFNWVTDEDDTVQSTLIKFCKQHELHYMTALTRREYVGIQHALGGGYCRLYNYFTIYMHMSHGGNRSPFIAFVTPCNKENVLLKDMNVSYKPVLSRRNDGDSSRINMMTNGLLQSVSVSKPRASVYVFRIYEAIQQLVNANRSSMWPDFPYLKKDGTSKVNIAVAVLLFSADYIAVCAGMMVTHAIKTKILRKRHAGRASGRSPARTSPARQKRKSMEENYSNLNKNAGPMYQPASDRSASNYASGNA
eukprot:2466636-Pleurochrysis_carterae.AAC.2